MKKTASKIAICTSIIVLGLSIKVLASPAQSVHPANTHNLGSYNENPKPILVANKDVPISSLISKEKLEADNSAYKIKNVKSKLKSVTLKTWQQYCLEDDPEFKAVNHQIDPDRMVWVEITEYPDGVDSKIGFYANATIKSVFDAQTGRILASLVTGAFQGTLRTP